jgi:hypothetical protein
VAEHKRAPVAPVREALGQASGLGGVRGDWAEDQQVLVVEEFVASYRLDRGPDNLVDEAPGNDVSPGEGDPSRIETCHDTFLMAPQRVRPSWPGHPSYLKSVLPA